MSQSDAVSIRPTTPADLKGLVRLTRETTRMSFAPVLGAPAVESYLGSGTNAFYRTMGWREAGRRPDPETGIPMLVFRKARPDSA